ncbi:MAG: toll/interleukin-1 receptor domain-containing protein [Alphaproteobacteria bacterium]|nr:toll/interleukin-1 receptor domain-containing protein [Alphaproteobacteria bacterium]
MISYKSADREVAEEIYAFLTARRHKVWIDLEMRSGVEWRSEFLKQVKAANVCVPIITEKYLASEHCRLELFVSRSYGHERPG